MNTGLAQTNSSSSTITKDIEDVLAIASLTQTAVYSIIYLTLVIYVILKIRPEKMDRSANFTIFSFMTC